MPQHAHGTFTVQLRPLPQQADGLKRMLIEKVFVGGMEGTSKGEMLSAGDPKADAAGYIAMETVSGKLDGRAGSFALQHFGTIDADEQKLEVLIVPGSGTGSLVGISGKFTLTVAGGQHSYDLEYKLPELSK